MNYVHLYRNYINQKWEIGLHIFEQLFLNSLVKQNVQDGSKSFLIV